MANGKKPGPTPKVKPKPTTEKVLQYVAKAEAMRDAEEAIYAPESNLPGVPVFEDVSAGRFCGRPAPPRQWLFTDLMPSGIVAMVSAAGGTGKSQLAATMARALATGQPVGVFDPAQPVRVLYLSHEEPEGELHRRFYELRPDRLLQENLLVYSLLGKGIGPFMERNEHRNIITSRNFEWVEKVVDAHKPKVLILDPLIKCYGLDENNNGEAALFMGVLELLVQRYDVTVLVVHHESKALAGSMNQHAGRGASAFVDCARWVANLKTMDQDTADKLGVLDRQKYLAFNVTKSNYAPMLPEPVYFYRGMEGRLEPTNIVKARMDDHVAALVGAYRQCGLELSLRDLFQGKDGKPVRDAAGLKNRETKDAAEQALRRGILEQVRLDSGGAGAKKTVLRLVEGQ